MEDNDKEKCADIYRSYNEENNKYPRSMKELENRAMKDGGLASLFYDFLLGLFRSNKRLSKPILLGKLGEFFKRHAGRFSPEGQENLKEIALEYLKWVTTWAPLWEQKLWCDQYHPEAQPAERRIIDAIREKNPAIYPACKPGEKFSAGFRGLAYCTDGSPSPALKATAAAVGLTLFLLAFWEFAGAIGVALKLEELLAASPLLANASVASINRDINELRTNPTPERTKQLIESTANELSKAGAGLSTPSRSMLLQKTQEK